MRFTSPWGRVGGRGRRCTGHTARGVDGASLLLLNWPALAPAVRVLGGETLERRTDEVGQRAQVVAAFEHGGDARGEARCALRQLAEAVGGDEHLREWILLVRVEAGRDEEQLGLE